MSTGTQPEQPMATRQDPELLDVLNVLASLCAGDFTARAEPREGLSGQVVERVNQLAALQERRTRELVRASRVIGREGRMTERLDEVGSEGDWSTGAGAVNSLIDDLVRPTTEVARVIAAVAEGDLSQQMALEIAGQPVKGEFLRIGTTVNTMVDQLSSFADEVTRVAREVGTEGKLGGQAQVKGVSGVWRDLTESVNSMAGNLTSQVRNIAQVTTAVAQGDLSQKITVDAQGEILELKSTVNTMVDQLSSFADEVTRVAREVGTEGKLGGQAQVKGVSGTWRDLTDSVNSMASTSPARSATSPRSRPPSPGATCRRRSPSTRRARSPRSPTRSTRWSTSCPRSPTRSPGWPARWAPRASSAARPRSRACRAPGRTSPTTSTSWPAT